MLVTHRYQDGQMMANYRFNPQTKELEHTSPDSQIHRTTLFMVFNEGSLVFEGLQEQLEAADDPYLARFKAGTSLKHH
jgi:phospholipid/cholesterol/gamma-HCH transport system ATP-binding protein